tara:strand:+ start:179 stop:556 length:378 start_codon:yes stop_codon:yes gene_type:complete
MEISLWILTGIIISSIFGRLFLLGNRIKIYKQLEADILAMIVSLEEDVAYMRTLKYLHMEQFGVDENMQKITKNMDEHATGMWKDSIIKKLISMYPPALRSTIEYYDWSTAIESHSKTILDRKNK